MIGTQTAATERYAKCLTNAKRVNWDIDHDVIRHRHLDTEYKFLPDGLSLVRDLPFLSAADARYFSQVQGRTYANMFGLVERFICATVLDATRDFRLGDQVALQALVQFSTEELKHQELFRRVESLAAARMPAGYHFAPDPDAVAEVVLSKSTWSVLGLTLLIELFTQVHYKESIAPDTRLSPLWKDVFLYHWREESQHATLDELEWFREDAKLSPAQRDAAVNDLIELVGAVDGILQAQAAADADYFLATAAGSFDTVQQSQVREQFLKAYRWQYIVSGVQIHRFTGVLGKLINADQSERVFAALGPIIQQVCV